MRRVEDARTGTRARPGSPSRPAESPGPLLWPFPGLRYDPVVAGPLASLLAPPHTELDRSTRTALLASSRYVVTHLERPEYDAGPGRAVQRWLDEGALVQDEPSFYVVRQEQDGRVQHFLTGQLDVSAHDDRVHPHEGVFEQAVTARLERLETTGVDSEPVLVVDRHPWPLSWTDPASLGRRVEVAENDRCHVEVWQLNDPDVLAELTAASATHRFLIADGHHRYAAVLRAAQRDGTPHSLLVAVADDAIEPVDLRALHRVLPRAAAQEVLRRAPRRRDVVAKDATGVALITDALGFEQALVVCDGDAVVVECPPATGTTVGSGAWVDTVVRGFGTGNSDVRYRPDAGAIWSTLGDRAAVFLPKPRVPALQELVRGGSSLGRKTTSFRPKPLAGTVLRLR
ncbi:DUF1015 family protein [Kineococcus sp. GCM10028916]|uniref:DUF1015 family protein n=1 Tax=Kineococcus sp. GCM10028916 TaxID=3273394 RepID=UPI003624E3C4